MPPELAHGACAPWQAPQVVGARRDVVAVRQCSQHLGWPRV